jgi:hypothetical protein
VQDALQRIAATTACRGGEGERSMTYEKMAHILRAARDGTHGLSAWRPVMLRPTPRDREELRI